MKSDDAAKNIVSQHWLRVQGRDESADEYYGVVMVGDIEVSRFKISREDYVSDTCAPCKSTIKKLRDQVAKGIREVYGTEQ